MTLTHESFWYDEEAAERAVQWFPKNLSHVKGPPRIVGQPLRLADWQANEVIRPLYGWKRSHDHSPSDLCVPTRCRYGRRKTRRLYLEVPRGNGKSTLGAGLALKGLIGDGESAPQIIGAATDRNSAKIIFDDSAGMVRHNPRLSDRLLVLDATKRIRGKRDGRLYHVIAAEARRAHGYHPTRIIFDELHAQPNRDLYDVLSTSQGTLDNPLLAMFTTAGYDKKSICGEMHDHAERVLNDPDYDEEFLAVIYAAAQEDDWTDPVIWAKANPNLDISVDRAGLAQKVALAQTDPAELNNTLRMHFNIWTPQETKWMPMNEWDKCGGVIVPADLMGRRCYGGLDLSTTTDLTAFVLVFLPLESGGAYNVVPWYWVPQDGIRRRSDIDHVPYGRYAQSGLIKAIPGGVIDMRVVKADLLALSRIYDIREIAFDRWGATQISNELNEEGLTVVPFGQGYRDFMGPTKSFMEYVLGGRINHGGHEVLRWNVDNLVVTQDPAGNMKPDKSKSTERIDGAVAMIMALGRAIANDTNGSAPTIRWLT